MTSEPSGPPRWLRVALLAELGLPSLVFFSITRESLAILVPLAGPWAARLYGHSCGVDAQAPWIAWSLALFGAGCLALAARSRRVLAYLPAALLWWPAWLGTALVSAANAHE